MHRHATTAGTFLRVSARNLTPAPCSEAVELPFVVPFYCGEILGFVGRTLYVANKGLVSFLPVQLPTAPSPDTLPAQTLAVLWDDWIPGPRGHV